MTKKERIAELERRIAELEMKLATPTLDIRPPCLICGIRGNHICGGSRGTSTIGTGQWISRGRQQ
jgi:hypothetical protein